VKTVVQGPHASPVGGSCVESRQKADELMMVCSLKEMSGDLHAALLCCNQAACALFWMLSICSLLRIIS